MNSSNLSISPVIAASLASESSATAPVSAPTVNRIVSVSASGTRTEIVSNGTHVTTTRITPTGSVSTREDRIIDGDLYREAMTSAASVALDALATVHAAEREGRSLARKAHTLATGGKAARTAILARLASADGMRRLARTSAE